MSCSSTRFRTPRQARFKRSRCASVTGSIDFRPPPNRGNVMRFMSIVGRLAFAAFVLSLVVGLVAAFGTRFHVWGFQVGLLKIFPFCLYLGLAGLALGV